MNEPIVESAAPKPAPILEVAWVRQAQLDQAAGRRTQAFYTIRRWITLLGVLATLFAILTQLLDQYPLFPTDPGAQALSGLGVKILFVITPVLASIFAAFAAKYYSNGSWLVYRAGSEEIKKEIYFYRTILQKDKTRRAYLEKRLAEIQRQLFRSLSGEFAFEDYKGPLPPHYNKQDPTSDPGFHDLTGDEYLKYRLQHQLNWHNNRVNQRKLWRRWMTIAILSIGGVGAVLAAQGNTALALWVAFTASITAALIGWQELRKVDETIRNYSKVVTELTILSDHWQNLEPEERTELEYYKMVRDCENVLWAQNLEYVNFMQEALKESETEKEASLVNQVIKDSVASAERAKEATRETFIEANQEFLAETERQFHETTKAVLGSLAEEASSELVQKELDAMSKFITETAGNLMERASSAFTASLEQAAQDYAHMDVSKDTPKEELNALLASLPKTSDVKG